jgi:F420-dependent oxidoreductase-like protein
MPYRLSISFNSRGARDRDQVFDRIRAADEAGVDTVWVAESWGEDAFTLMAQLAERTGRIKIGSGIVNCFSRTPAAIAQHFATLDNVSEGRMLIGLGTSGAQVIEHFHGIPFEKPLRRLREYVEIINILISGEKLDYSGQIFQLHRGFTLNMERYRDHIPVYLATLSPRSVAQTAEIADGWLPIWTPVEDLGDTVANIQSQADLADRPRNALDIRSPGGVTVTKDVERGRAAVAGTFAFYIARMGVFYYNHISRLGYKDVADAIRSAWNEGGSAAAAAAVPPGLQQSLTLVTDSIDQARERLAQEQAAGIDLHTVNIDAESPADLQRTYEALMR